MKFFIDTANLDDIKRLKDVRLLDWVTTNPTLTSKEAGDFRKLIAQICEVAQGPVWAEVVSTESAKMIVDGRIWPPSRNTWSSNVRRPGGGVKACSKLVESGIRVNMTFVFQPIQALIVAKAGASYVSPFPGRLDDFSQDSMSLLETCREIYDNYALKTGFLPPVCAIPCRSCRRHRSARVSPRYRQRCSTSCSRIR